MSALDSHININFVWKGPKQFRGGISHGGVEVLVVDLLFKDAKSAICVHIPEEISRVAATSIPFTHRRYRETEVTIRGNTFRPLEKETHPNTLKVTVEQIRNLTLRAGFFEKGRPIGPKTLDPSTGKVTQQETVQRSDEEIALQIPKKFEADQTYSLVVTSENLSLSARLVKRTKAPLKPLEEKKVNREGEAQHPTPTPDTNSSETSSELSALDTKELKFRFERTYIQDKKYAVQRMEAVRNKDVEKVETILKEECANSQILRSLALEIEKRGLTPQIPQTKESLWLAAQESILQLEMLNNIFNECKTQ